jgi:hypothetical protein
LKGQKLASFSPENLAGEVNFSTADLLLSNGIYFLKIATDKGQKMAKFLYYK